jgi:hypothetical protein
VIEEEIVVVVVVRVMAKMADETPLLSAGTLRVLADKLYEKRKNAARRCGSFYILDVFEGLEFCCSFL